MGHADREVRLINLEALRLDTNGTIDRSVYHTIAQRYGVVSEAEADSHYKQYLRQFLARNNRLISEDIISAWGHIKNIFE